MSFFCSCPVRLRVLYLCLVFEIDVQEAEATLLDIQSKLDNASDTKAKLELTSKLKKARARLQFAQQKNS